MIKLNRSISEKAFLLGVFSLLGTLFFSCRKFVEVETPKTQLVGTTVFANDATATASLLSVYISMEESQAFTVAYNTGLSADELFNFDMGNPLYVELNDNAITKQNIIITGMWNSGFNYIYNVNKILEQVANSATLSSTVKQQLTGEAKFIRAFWNFYLVNFFGDIPLITTSDYRINAHVSRATKNSIYDQIISDLKDAQDILSDNYLDASNQVTSERVRPNKSAATALLARVYLFKEDWVDAETQATSVIDNSQYSLPGNLNDIFLKNSSEAIWQLMPVESYYNTAEGNQFPILAPGAGLSNSLVNSFESGDQRRNNWIDSTIISGQAFYYPYKYKIGSITPGTPYEEYSMVLRLAEQFLIRAEARAKQNKITEAQSDLNLIRNRAGLGNTTANDQGEILMAIEQERKSELFTEWSHRWFDLIRTNRANSVLGSLKGASWQPTDVLYPIPQIEIQNNSNLTQNPGY